MAFGLGGPEIVVIILVIVIIFFGAKKIPELARGLGRAMGEFKRGKAEVEQEMQQGATNPPSKVAKKPKAEGDSIDPKLVEAAKALGIETEGKTEAQLKEEIAKAMKKGA